MNVTDISWCDFSANPLKYRRKSDDAVVWGCIKASPGCTNCYSESLANRYGRGGKFIVSVMAGLEPFLDEKELHKMLTAKTIGGKQVSGSRVFIGDMTDVAGQWVPDVLLDQLFAVFALRQDVLWMVLTKRASRMRQYMTGPGLHNRLELAADAILPGKGHPSFGGKHMLPNLPMSNIALGVSVENQQYADERIPELLQTPAAMRYVSYEPALGPVDFCAIKDGSWYDAEGATLYNALSGCAYYRNGEYGLGGGPRLDLIIAGGESGSKRRPCEIEWFDDVQQHCADAGVSFHMKQDHGPRPGMQGRIPLELWEHKDLVRPRS